MREELLEARGRAAVSIEGWSPTRRAAAGAREQSRLSFAARSAPPVPNAGRRQHCLPTNTGPREPDIWHCVH